MEFYWKTVLENLDAIRPGMRMMKVSAKTGEGMDDWQQLLHSHRSSAVGLA